MPAAVGQELDVVALAVQRIGGDQGPVQIRQGVQHRGEGGDLIPTGHRGLGENQLGGVIVDAHQLGPCRI